MVHKQFLINPYDLVSAGFNVTKICQEEGEVVMTFPKAYHCGFNIGDNINEAFNFGTRNWFSNFFDFKSCKCGRVPKLNKQLL